MIRVVLDTNILVSATIKPAGPESAVVELAAASRITLCFSPAMLAEFREVLLRPKFSLDPSRVERFLKSLESAAVILQPERALSACPDEADNRFLECAEAAEADYLVTGNKRHFPARWRGTRVVNARELLAILS
jgi:putative PIN family toxin of toxin-antitoxin system